MSDTRQPRVPPHVRNAIESIRGRVIDIEANANAAAASLDGIPYLPRLPRHPRPDVKPEWTETQRRDLGRMQSMVYATADAAELLLDEYNQILVAIGVEVSPGDDRGSDPGADVGGRDNGEEHTDDEPAAGACAADVPGVAEHPDPRPSLGRAVVEFRPLPPNEHADGVVTRVIEDVATRPCHRTPAEHEAALLAGAPITGSDATPRPAAATHRS